MLYLLIITILLTALWNGLVIQWFLTKDEKYSTWWHRVGFVIRALLVVVIYLAGGWVWALGAAFASWIPYNIIISLLMGQKWYYIGKTSYTDKLLRVLFPQG